ncbi:MAG: MoaD/ThiS family protein [Spirochaetales bacterium]|nr:MoaD/ThiS family protein [Spirochaetales bacterium]
MNLNSMGFIQVKTFATLSKLYPGYEQYPLEAADSVGTVIDRLGIPANKIAIIFVNNIHADRELVLKAGDVLAIFPPIGGG